MLSTTSSVSRNVFCYTKKRLMSSFSWDLLTGVCVERGPRVIAPLTDMQTKFKNYLETVEAENSLKSDHERRHEKDKVQAELLKNESADVDMEAVSKITAQDFEDACNEEFSQFKPADIITDADKKNDKTSTERVLQRHLVLTTKQRVGDKELLIFPQGIRQEGETLRQTAERVLNEKCGPDLKVQFLGNAPCGFYKYKYPKEIDGKVGAKIFFYYAKYISESLSKPSSPYQWLTRSEIGEIFPERYHQSVSDFLVQERV